MTTHELKTWPAFFKAIAERRKTFEVRNNDRDFRVGDELVLREWSSAAEMYTGSELRARVTYVMYGGQFGVEPSHVVMGIAVLP